MATEREHGATLYLRGVPEAVVRESKARAARRGISLTAYVTELLALAVAESDMQPATAGPGLEGDLGWYRAHRDTLAARHAGEYLAIVDQQVFDHDEDFAALARRVRERFASRPVLMPKCVAGGRVVSLPSPRIRRP